MARFSNFTSHISLLIVISLLLAVRISSVSSSSLAPSPYHPEVEYVSTVYRFPSFGSPSPAETEYDSLSRPVYPPSGLSRYSEPPLPETDEYSDAPISPTIISVSPEQPPLTSSFPFTPVKTPNSPTPSTSLPSLSSTDENVESSPAPCPEDEEDCDPNLWPDQQITSSMPYKSSSSNSDADDSVVNEQKPEKRPAKETEDGSEEKGGKGGVAFGVAMGVCMVGLGGLVYMKRRKRNDVRRTRSYMQLAERKSLI